jgi:hypothetical protein
MARRPKYSQEKRLKELERQKNKQNKKLRKLEREHEASSLQEAAGPEVEGTKNFHEPE